MLETAGLGHCWILETAGVVREVATNDLVVVACCEMVGLAPGFALHCWKLETAGIAPGVAAYDAVVVACCEVELVRGFASNAGSSDQIDEVEVVGQVGRVAGSGGRGCGPWGGAQLLTGGSVALAWSPHSCWQSSCGDRVFL